MTMDKLLFEKREVVVHFTSGVLAIAALLRRNIEHHARHCGSKPDTHKPVGLIGVNAGCYFDQWADEEAWRAAVSALEDKIDAAIGQDAIDDQGCRWGGGAIDPIRVDDVSHLTLRLELCVNETHVRAWRRYGRMGLVQILFIG